MMAGLTGMTTRVFGMMTGVIIGVNGMMTCVTEEVKNRYW